MVIVARLPVNMVKRSCPFNDDMNPQMKIHVSEKEIAGGVMSDQHMKLVYDKTKDLLFQGAKKISAHSLEVNLLMNAPKTYCDFPSIKSNGLAPLKQMLLNCQGQLSASGGTRDIPPRKEATCCKCGAVKQIEIFMCSFCDVPLCSSCIQICVKCQDNFCTACSFNTYGAAEGYICSHCC